MATDYDAPRRDEVDLGEDSLEELKTRRTDAQSGAVDVDETEVAESFELPGSDLSDEELTVKVLPMQPDEFRCSRCFLVHHHSQLARKRVIEQSPKGQVVERARQPGAGKLTEESKQQVLEKTKQRVLEKPVERVKEPVIEYICRECAAD